MNFFTEDVSSSIWEAVTLKALRPLLFTTKLRILVLMVRITKETLIRLHQTVQPAPPPTLATLRSARAVVNTPVTLAI